MHWVNSYENMLERDKEMFQECANRLLSQTYLVAARDSDSRYYRFTSRHFDVISGYLQLAGWMLTQNKDHGVLAIYHEYDKNRRNLTLAETLFLFILRLLYEEKQRELLLTRQLVITNRDIQEKYVALKIKNRLPALDEYQRILKLFEKHSLIELRQGSWEHPEAVIALFPSLFIAISAQTVEMFMDWIQKSEEELIYHEISEEIVDD